MSTRIYLPEGQPPYTQNVRMSDAETHIKANDQWASEAKVLTAYHTGEMDCYSETDDGQSNDGIPWVDIDWDDDKAKRSVKSWDIVANYAVVVADGDGSTAVDVEVQVGEADGAWYISTTDDAGGNDDCDATSYDSRQAAISAAKDFAESRDECDGVGAKNWIERQDQEAIESGKSAEGKYCLAHADGTRWDKDRYSDRDAAELAISSWCGSVQRANPGTDLLWHLMDCPVLAEIDLHGNVCVIADESAA